MSLEHLVREVLRKTMEAHQKDTGACLKVFLLVKYEKM